MLHDLLIVTSSSLKAFKSAKKYIILVKYKQAISKVLKSYVFEMLSAFTARRSSENLGSHHKLEQRKL